MRPRDRLIVALDVAEAKTALDLASRLSGSVGMFKVGSQLFCAAGPGLVRELVARGERIFLDLKYHDIPNTVVGAVTAASGLGVTLLTVHGLGGATMLGSAARAMAASPTKMLAVTILTSHDESSLKMIGVQGPVPEAVARLARMARGAGADGIVCSPQEVALVREACGPDLLIVTPGIRPAGSDLADQARAATPAAALVAGADYLVVGRPITQAQDPKAAAVAILDQMQ